MKSLLVKRLVLTTVFFVFGACVSKKDTWKRPIPVAEAKITDAKPEKSNKVSSTRNVLNRPKIRKLQKRQALRMSKVEYYKLKKHIGEKENGLLGVRSAKGLSKAEEKKMKKIVSAENKDREILYSTITSESKLDKKTQVIMRKNFFNSYQAWAPKGSYYFLNGKWQTKGK